VAKSVKHWGLIWINCQQSVIFYWNPWFWQPRHVCHWLLDYPRVLIQENSLLVPNIPNPKTTRTGHLVFPVSVSLSLQSVARRHRFSADHGNSYSTPHPPRQPHVTFESLQSPWQLQPAMWSSGRESPIWGLSHMLLGSSPVLVGKPAHVSSYCSPSCY